MVKDADKFRSEDLKRRERVEARNQADALIYQAEKLIREDQAGKLSAFKADLALAAIRVC